MAKSTKKPQKIYMDFAASASPNPSSIHELGVNARKKLEEARGIVAGMLGARSQEIIFTSGGTESNNMAIQGVIFAFREQKNSLAFLQPAAGTFRRRNSSVPVPHIITTNIEHPSVLETCKLLVQRGFAEVSIVAVETNGVVDPKKIKKEIKKNTVLVSVMYANNEIGTIQPIKEIAKAIRHYKKQNKRNNIFFHTDAVQAVNYLDLKVEKLGVDMLTLSGSKIEGAGRVGVLYKKNSVSFVNIFGGGDQEQRLRPGTENLPEILKFSVALKSAQNIKEKETKRLTKLRNYFFHSLIRANSRIVVNGDMENRLPNNVNITLPKIPSDLMVIELSAKGIMASSKSACESSKDGGSYVIKALRPESDPEIGGLRFSLGGDTTKKDIDLAVKALYEILQKLEKWYD
ncbi:MAG TPA: cysteine desulfurase family protein [Candidatus Paceibacterota bacterium]